MSARCRVASSVVVSTLLAVVAVGAFALQQQPDSEGRRPIRLLELVLADPLALRYAATPATGKADVLRRFDFLHGTAGFVRLDELGRRAGAAPPEDGTAPGPIPADASTPGAFRFPNARGGLALAMPMTAQRLLRVVARVRRQRLRGEPNAVEGDRAKVRLFVLPTLRELALPTELGARSLLDLIAGDPVLQATTDSLTQSREAPADGVFHELAVRVVTPPGTRGLLLLFAAGDGSVPSIVDVESIRIEEPPYEGELAFACAPAVGIGAGDDDPDGEVESRAVAAALPELGLHPPPHSALPMVRRVEHLLEQRVALLLPPPAGGEIEVILPRGRWLLEYGVARMHEARRSYARHEATVVTTVSREGATPLQQTTILAAGDAAAGWIDRALPITMEKAGRVRVGFAATARGGDDLVAIGSPLLRPAGDRDGRLNVVLLSLDTVRADHLSVNGYPRPTTPNLDALARESAWFRDASSTSSYTLPAHASLLTGQLPTRHGAHSESPGRNRIRADRSDLLAEQLRSRGWLTAAFTGGVYVRPGFGFVRGFDRFDSTDLALPLDAPRARELPRPGDPEFNARYRRAHDWNRALDWIHAHADSPFFLFLHTYVAHEYLASPQHEARFLTSRRSTVARGDLDLIRNRQRTDPPNPGDLQQFVDAYDASLREADTRVGELLATLEDAGVEDRTILIVCSDHGEEFLDHGGVNHGRTLYEEMVRVPLLIRLPGAAPREIDLPVSLLDVAPTLVELLSLPATHPVDGRSLLPLLHGRPGFVRAPFASELELVPENRWQRMRVDDRTALEVRDERANSVILRSGKPRTAPRGMVHDVVRDPQQTRDLRDGSPDEEAAAAELLSELELQREEARQRRLDARQSPAEASAASDAFDLRAVGYSEAAAEEDEDSEAPPDDEN
jgi:arylsulfatase A-like enzyme